MIGVDGRTCLECRLCEVACSLFHEGRSSPHLSRIRVVFDDFVPGFPVHDVCQQCERPECYYACISACGDPAMYIHVETGARVIDESKCSGCGACAEACPLMPDRPVMGFKEMGGGRVFYKCDLCMDRASGPVCVEVCPPGALRFIGASERYRDG